LASAGEALYGAMEEMRIAQEVRERIEISILGFDRWVNNADHRGKCLQRNFGLPALTKNLARPELP
jgi:fumarylacetoacetate (FAA) hydrolase family protein